MDAATSSAAAGPTEPPARAVAQDGPAPAQAPSPVLRQAPWIGAEPPLGQLVAAAASAVLGAVLIEVLLRGGIGLLVGAALVLVSVGVALTARPRDLFAAGVLPPLLLVAVLTVVAVAYPSGIGVDQLEPSAGLAQRVIAGFVHLAGALVAAHALALVVVGQRVRLTRRPRPSSPRA